MRKLKKRVKVPQRSYPRSLPCNHIPSVHPTTNGKLVVICSPRIRNGSAFIDIAPKVWCVRCGWVSVTDSDYEYYRGFDGAQRTIRAGTTSGECTSPRTDVPN